MISTGPYKHFPIPAGSIIVCWKCEEWLFITSNGMDATQELEHDRLIDIRSGTIIMYGDYEGPKCPSCGKQIYRSRGDDLGLVRYIGPPETLGERIHHFMVQGAHP